MKITVKKLDSLQPYKKNSKAHPPEQVELIARSIKEFGFLVPLVIDSAGVIVAGHGRYAAARSIGLVDVPTVDAGHLTPEQIKAFRIADNKVAESDWIDDLLNDELHSLADAGYDLSLTGFSLEDIAGRDDLEQRILDEPEYQPDKADIGKQITERLEEIAAADPHRFEKADCIVLPLRKGSRDCLIMVDANTSDAIRELRRYHAAGESSPVEKLFKSIFSMRPTDENHAENHQ
jgi:ParB-like chromosome segregation protein Spo0J